MRCYISFACVLSVLVAVSLAAPLGSDDASSSAGVQVSKHGYLFQLTSICMSWFTLENFYHASSCFLLYFLNSLTNVVFNQIWHFQNCWVWFFNCGSFFIFEWLVNNDTDMFEFSEIATAVTKFLKVFSQPLGWVRLSSNFISFKKYKVMENFQICVAFPQLSSL